VAWAEGRRRPSGICRACGRSRWGLALICRRRDCPGYAPIWAGDQRRKLFENLTAYPGATVRLGAVTAPGKAELPWDSEHCRALGEHTCSGGLGCRVVPDAAKAWNAEASERWSALNRTAYQRVQRELGLTPWVLARVWEMQHRGVLHVHPVLAYGTIIERQAADRYLELVDKLAAHYGFGYSERKRRLMPARAAAAYLSSYFVTGKKEKVALHRSVMDPEMPRSIVHVSVKLTQATGCTMRELRFRRFVWRVAGNWVAIGYYAVARAIANYWQENGYPPRFEHLKGIIRAHDPPDD
jgi:hypothetical protein